MKSHVYVGALLAFASVFGAANEASAQFTYQPAGTLTARSGRGRSDQRVYVPGMRFPIQNAPAYLNSQVWGVGGGSGPSGSQCSSPNYSYPWWDNYCESRTWSMPLCPSGQGHQGQDMRAANCMNNVHRCVAVANGSITQVGSYSVYLTTSDGTRFDYLHMGGVQVGVGDRVTRGEWVGNVSNLFGGSATTIHLHFNIRQNVSGVGTVYVPPYMSLVRAYEDLLMMSGTSTDAGPGNDAGTSTGGTLSGRYVNQTFPLSEMPWAVAPGSMHSGYLEMRNTGTVTWTPALTTLRTTEPRDGQSAIACPSWEAPNIAAHIDSEVPPGGMGRFVFSICAPATAGVYPQFFNLNHNGVWFSDSSGTPPDNQIELRPTVDMNATMGTDADRDGYTVENGDCNDQRDAVHPNATEVCGNSVDEDCDGSDATCSMMMVTDRDMDGATVEGGDCDDNNPTVRPGASELCGNGVDEDCSGADLDCPPGVDGGHQVFRLDGGQGSTIDAFTASTDNDSGMGMPRPTRNSGCGCAAPRGSSSAPWMLAGLGALLVSRRRKR